MINDELGYVHHHDDTRITRINVNLYNIDGTMTTRIRGHGAGTMLTLDNHLINITNPDTGVFYLMGTAGSGGRSVGRTSTMADHAFYSTMYYSSSEETEEEIIDKKENNDYTMREVRDILEKVYSNESLRKSVVPLFIGDPGLGKTVMIQEFADEKGAKLVELITSQMSPFEISGIAMPDKETQKMTYFNFDKLENLKDGDILFFDELLNGNPVVLNACLTILEQRKFISGKDLPNIMIVAAANPQGMSPLTPQIKERFIWYDVKFDEELWSDYMVKKYSMNRGMCSKLSNLIKTEQFEGRGNFYTPRSVDKAVNMIIHDVNTPYEEVIKPALSTMVQNPFKEAVELPDGRELASGEMIDWLELIKLKMLIT